MYDLEPERVRKFLRREDPEKAAIQLPSGLRSRLKEVRSVYDEEGVEALFLGGSCFGSCDLADDTAEEAGCDVLVHYGHADMGIPTSLPVLYIEARVEIEPFDALEGNLHELKGSRWGLTTTVQHIDLLKGTKEFLGERGVEALIGEPGPRSRYPGQILGCDWGSARSIADEVDGFIYIGTGRFHPLGISLATDKRVATVNPVSDEFEVMEPKSEDFIRRRLAMLARSEDVENFGVLVSTKPGQERLDLAESLADKLNRQGYESFVIVCDDIEPLKLNDYRLGALVNTACPRIPIDDSDLYDCPVLTPFEARVLLGEEGCEEYHLDEIGVNF